MNREQMIAWLTLEGWRVFLWNNYISHPRIMKELPQYKEHIFHWHAGSNRWGLAGASVANDYHEVSWDRLTEKQIQSFLEAVS